MEFFGFIGLDKTRDGRKKRDAPKMFNVEGLLRPAMEANRIVTVRPRLNATLETFNISYTWQSFSFF